MPPRIWHMVYTPVGGMTSGGHFMLYDTMHLTYLSQRYNTLHLPGPSTFRGELATNEAQSTYRQVIRMLLALPQASYGSKLVFPILSDDKC